MCDNTGCDSSPMSDTREEEKCEQRASSCHCPLGTRVKGLSSGAFQSPAAENPPGDIAAAEEPSAECREGSVASCRHDDLPRCPEHSFQKRSLEGRRGFDNFSRRVGSGDMLFT